MLRRFRKTAQDTAPPSSVEAEAAAELRRAAEALGGSPLAGVAAPPVADPATDPAAGPSTEEAGTPSPAAQPAPEASSAATVRRVRKVPPAKGASDGGVDRAASTPGSQQGPAAGRATRSGRS